MVKDERFILVFVLTSCYLSCSLAEDSKTSYVIPYKWKGRIDWRDAELVTDLGNEVVLQTSAAGSLPTKFSKQEVALNEKLQDSKGFVGMEVLARLGVDGNKQNLYAFGVITSRVRPRQFIVKPRCQSKAMSLGVGAQHSIRVKSVPDSHMTSSSVYSKDYPPHLGRLGNQKVWCPSRRGVRGSWLQVDLGAPHYICSVAAQGDQEKGQEWTKSYSLTFSNDGRKFVYARKNGAIKNFAASVEGTEVSVDIETPYRYVRFSPTSYNKFPCLGVEIYGIGPVRSFLPNQELNVDELFPLGDPLVPYLLVPYTWKGRTDWRLARLISQSGPNVQVKMFPGSTTPAQYSTRDIVLNVAPRSDNLHIGSPVYAPFAKDKDGAPMFAVGRVSMAAGGKFLITPICSQFQKSLPIGAGLPNTLPLERVKSLPDSHFSATSTYSGYDAKQGRHGNRLVWCAANDQLRSSTFQVDLGGLYVICSVMVQGNLNTANQWVTSFKISMSTDGRRWKIIQDSKGKQIFQRSGREPSEIHLGLKTPYKHVMFTPISYNNHPCMGVELYGVGPLSNPSNMFTPKELRIKGNICELDHECSTATKCIVGSTLGTYSCQCPSGFISTADGGPNIKPGTREWCRSINPTGKAVLMHVEAPPEDAIPATSVASETKTRASHLIVLLVILVGCYGYSGG